ncbi:DNA-binding protein [Pantoea sp. GbtcB22]|uniref:ParB/RepB/Spo0J family partition protein n=1 Tax=Pantoea sp. GbtcB22 TaxID=2824767 RepID=UPI001C306073|nr:DNA-binding protein [Pantoea sp. GbtcB22]
MSSLLSLYKAKEKNGTEMSAKKTFLVPLSELYIEPGYNVREIDQAHIEEFRDAYIAGEFVPPLAVQVTDKGIKVIDGHHRYHGALLATESGTEIPRLECKDFSGTEADRIAFMVTSSQGKPLTSLERAAAYQRLANQGWEPTEIAKRVKRSPSDVDHHLQLLTCGDELIEMVKTGAVAATTAVALSREHGPKAGAVALEQMAKVKAAGKTKLSRSAAMPQFSATRARRLVELLSGVETFPHGDASALALSPQNEFEVLAILEEYRAQHAGKDSQ